MPTTTRRRISPKELQDDIDNRSLPVRLLGDLREYSGRLGSLFIAPWADRHGRLPIILGCLVLCGVTMVLASTARSWQELGLMRVLTGLGIGGILACSNVIASEYASRRWRGLAVSLQSTGYALGATLGGLLAVWLIGAWGWRWAPSTSCCLA